MTGQNTFQGQSGPTVEILQDGDLLWPRAKGQFVPYILQPNANEQEDMLAWESGKEGFFRRLEDIPTYLSEAQLQRLKNLSYEDFRRAYDTGPYRFGSNDPSLKVPVSVGHVAVVEIKGGTSPNVIEAVWGNIGKVRRIPFADWSTCHATDLVWLGRVSGFGASARSRISSEAVKYIGRPYDFWNFNLADTSGFYCSKLAWLTIMDGLGFAVDGNDNPKRAFWFSPKQLINEPKIELIVNQGPYLL